MLAELGRLLPNFRGAAVQSRCFAHIINLVVKSILRQFDKRRSKRDYTYIEDTEGSLEEVDDVEDTNINDIDIDDVDVDQAQGGMEEGDVEGDGE